MQCARASILGVEAQKSDSSSRLVSLFCASIQSESITNNDKRGAHKLHDSILDRFPLSSASQVARWRELSESTLYHLREQPNFCKFDSKCEIHQNKFIWNLHKAMYSDQPKIRNGLQIYLTWLSTLFFIDIQKNFLQKYILLGNPKLNGWVNRLINGGKH